MKLKVVAVIIIMYLWAFAFGYLVVKYQAISKDLQQVNTVNKTISETKRELAVVQGQVYEQNTWLAELQSDIWELQAQDEAFNRRFR